MRGSLMLPSVVIVFFLQFGEQAGFHPAVHHAVTGLMDQQGSAHGPEDIISFGGILCIVLGNAYV